MSHNGYIERKLILGIMRTWQIEYFSRIFDVTRGVQICDKINVVIFLISQLPIMLKYTFFHTRAFAPY